MDRVAVHAPEVFTDLRKLVTVPTANLSKHIDQWARCHHLLKADRTPPWVRTAARSSIGIWRLKPAAGSWSGHVGGSDWSEDMLVSAYYDPLNETRGEFHARMDHRLDEIESVVKSRAPSRPTRTKRELIHFDWAARFQCAEEAIKTIAQTQSPDQQQTVQKAVYDVLKLIGLSRRNRAGRPSAVPFWPASALSELKAVK